MESRRLVRTVTLAAGWSAIVVGLALIPLPGPGSLLAIAGLRLLVPHHAWAARLYEPARDRAVGAARAGVTTWPRVALSAVGPAAALVVATAYVLAVRIPVVAVAGLRLGPELPFQGVATTVALLTSAVTACLLLGTSIVRWGPPVRLLAIPGTARRRAARLITTAPVATTWGLVALLPAVVAVVAMTPPPVAL